MTLAAGSVLNVWLGEQNVREGALMLGLERNEKTEQNDEPILADELLNQRTLDERRDQNEGLSFEMKPARAANQFSPDGQIGEMLVGANRKSFIKEESVTPNESS